MIQVPARPWRHLPIAPRIWHAGSPHQERHQVPVCLQLRQLGRHLGSGPSGLLCHLQKGLCDGGECKLQVFAESELTCIRQGLWQRNLSGSSNTRHGRFVRLHQNGSHDALHAVLPFSSAWPGKEVNVHRRCALLYLSAHTGPVYSMPEVWDWSSNVLYPWLDPASTDDLSACRLLSEQQQTRRVDISPSASPMGGSSCESLPWCQMRTRTPLRTSPSKH